MASAFRRPPLQHSGTAPTVLSRKSQETVEFGTESPASPDTFLADVRARRAKRANRLGSEGEGVKAKEVKSPSLVS